MKVLGKVIDVESRSYTKNGESKQLAEITFKSGKSVFQVTMFDADISNGKLELYKSQAGKNIAFEIDVDIYKGRIQYRLGFADPQLVGPKAADTKAA